MVLMNYFLFFSVFIFLIGLWGIILNKRNALSIIMAVELLLLGGNLNFLIFSVFLDDLKGQIFSLLVLTVAAAESAVGFSILVLFYQKHQTISFDDIYSLHG